MDLILTVCFLFIVVGIGSIYLILRKNPSPLPRGPLQWMVSSMCVILVCLSSLILVLLTWTYEQPASFDPASVDVEVESFEFRLVSSQEKKNISDYSGQVILLNFWATWCQPCITELPELDELQATYRDKGLVVMTVSDEKLEELQLYTDLLPKETVSGYIRYENLPEIFRNELANGRPVTYVIDAGGIIREHVRGAGNLEYFEGLVTPWLAERES